MSSMFGKQLQILRKQKEMTQKEFEAFLGIPQPSLSAYENNRTSPTLDVLINIADKCCVSLDWLCGISSVQHNLATMADISDFLYALFDIEDLTLEITGDDSNKYIAVSGDALFCSLLQEIEDNNADFQSFCISSDVYNMTKAETKNRYAQFPLSKKKYPLLSREEREKQHRQYLFDKKS